MTPHAFCLSEGDVQGRPLRKQHLATREECSRPLSTCARAARCRQGRPELIRGLVRNYVQYISPSIQPCIIGWGARGKYRLSSVPRSTGSHSYLCRSAARVDELFSHRCSSLCLFLVLFRPRSGLFLKLSGFYILNNSQSQPCIC